MNIHRRFNDDQKKKKRKERKREQKKKICKIFYWMIVGAIVDKLGLEKARMSNRMFTQTVVEAMKES